MRSITLSLLPVAFGLGFLAHATVPPFAGAGAAVEAAAARPVTWNRDRVTIVSPDASKGYLVVTQKEGPGRPSDLRLAWPTDARTRREVSAARVTTVTLFELRPAYQCKRDECIPCGPNPRPMACIVPPPPRPAPSPEPPELDFVGNFRPGSWR